MQEWRSQAKYAILRMLGLAHVPTIWKWINYKVWKILIQVWSNQFMKPALIQIRLSIPVVKNQS